MTSFEDYQRSLMWQMADAFALPMELVAASGHGHSAARHMALVLREQRAARDRAAMVYLLGQWVSEVDPVIYLDHHGEIVGVGDRFRAVVLMPHAQWQKALFDDCMRGIGVGIGE